METAYSLPYLSMGGECLPSLQEVQTYSIEMAVFAPSSCVDCCLTDPLGSESSDGDQLGLASADCTPAGTATTAFFSGDWQAAVIRSSERSSSPETSPLGFMVADPSHIWVSSTAQSADTRVLAAAEPVAAPAPLPAAGSRVVPRSRAHRAYAAKDKDSKSPADMATEVVYRTSTGQACEQQPGSVWVQQDAEEEQPPPPKRAKRAPSQRQAAAAAAAAAGAPSAFSGVLQPFQAVKGYGLGNSLTLQQINARLKHAAQRTASPSL